MGYSYAYEFEEFLGLGLIPTILSGLPSIALGVAAYVLTALALYTIAKRRGLKNPWMAWIPVADAWLLGSVSDQYRYVVKREYKSKRKILLTLRLISTVCGLVAIVMCTAAMVGLFQGVMQSLPEQKLLGKIMGPLMGVLGLCVPMVGVTIAYTIIRYMALYDVYNSLDPKNSVMYLVLGILFGVTEPFFLFFNRNKDEGMPARKQTAEPVQELPDYDQSVYEQPQDPPRDPWNKDEPDYL